MTVWEVDVYRRPLRDAAGRSLWELVACWPDGTVVGQARQPQPAVNAAWITQQLEQWATETPPRPETVRVFRPQAQMLLEAACQPLGIPVTPTRRVPALKQLLQAQAQTYPQQPNYTGEPIDLVTLEQPPPSPAPDALLGDRWRFAALPARDVAEAFTGRPIPILELPPERLPLELGLASSQPIPGVVIDGGRNALRLAQWIQQTRPVALHYIPGAPDSLILAAGLVERWVLLTFEDATVRQAATVFRDRQQAAQGLHFLLVQPDDAGVTYSGFWLLQTENATTPASHAAEN